VVTSHVCLDPKSIFNRTSLVPSPVSGEGQGEGTLPRGGTLTSILSRDRPCRNDWSAVVIPNECEGSKISPCGRNDTEADGQEGFCIATQSRSEGEEAILQAWSITERKKFASASVLTQRCLPKIVGVATDCGDEILKHWPAVDQAGIHSQPFPPWFDLDDK
jgi:hypothetical protein